LPSLRSPVPLPTCSPRPGLTEAVLKDYWSPIEPVPRSLRPGKERSVRYLKTPRFAVAPLLLALFLGLAGCGDDHRDHFRGGRDDSRARYERQDNDGQKDHGEYPGRDRGEHGDR